MPSSTAPPPGDWLAAAPGAVQAVNRFVEVNRPPEADSASLCGEIGRYYGLPRDAVLVGPGTASLLHGIVARHAPAGGSVVFSEPSFFLYRWLVEAYGLTHRAVPLRDYRHDVAAIGAAITQDTRLVLVDSPNNVTGTTISLPEVRALAQRLPAGAVLVFDNVYGEYAPERIESDFGSTIGSGLPIVICRSFSKARQLFGLRVGYLLGAPSLLRAVGPRVLRYDVSGPAQAAAVASMQDEESMRRNVRLMAAAVEEAAALLGAQGFRVVAGHAGSVLIDCRERGPALPDALRSAGCDVRSDHPGLPDHVQLLISDHTTVGRVRAALRSASLTGAT
ncbi:histidinol-phosphate transaminase [Micromonospora sp. NPDC049523]|uniref:pyridoxal phosphate-dependent aminotransferase n=1 Tax=Micromonospora sp. NPDC049523 TaxID=3155921 RepID=UPI0034170FD6